MIRPSTRAVPEAARLEPDWTRWRSTSSLGMAESRMAPWERFSACWGTACAIRSAISPGSGLARISASMEYATVSGRPGRTEPLFGRQCLRLAEGGAWRPCQCSECARIKSGDGGRCRRRDAVRRRPRSVSPLAAFVGARIARRVLGNHSSRRRAAEPLQLRPHSAARRYRQEMGMPVPQAGPREGECLVVELGRRVPSGLWSRARLHQGASAADASAARREGERTAPGRSQESRAGAKEARAGALCGCTQARERSAGPLGGLSSRSLGIRNSCGSGSTS